MATRPRARRVLPTSPFKTAVADAQTFEVDDWVNHDVNGLGRVVGGQEGVDVVVDFRGGHVVRFALPSTKLTPLSVDEA